MTNEDKEATFTGAFRKDTAPGIVQERGRALHADAGGAQFESDARRRLPLSWISRRTCERLGLPCASVSSNTSRFR